ncbi:MAG: hypothetical protein N2260_05075 [Syntrophobacterales bacterium]|nr:hypothetical protein [Syntrophobacterales bacterium]
MCAGQIKHPSEDLLRRVEELERQVSMLAELVKAWAEVSFPAGFIHPVELLMRQRGFNILSSNSLSDVLLPVSEDPKIHFLYYKYLGRYSFRLFLKDLLHKGEGSDWRSISRYCSYKTAKTFIKFLSQAGIVKFGEDGLSYRYTGPLVKSFGATLEWYVAEIMRREFLAPTLFGVKLSETLHGGDYDVLSILQGYLIYIEVKSSPPRGVERPMVEAFVHRLGDLSPDITIFLVDTELRMSDKIVVLFEEVTGRKPQRIIRELFYLDGYIYIINTKRSIGSNIRRCLQHFFANCGGLDENYRTSLLLSLGKSYGE